MYLHLQSNNNHKMCVYGCVFLGVGVFVCECMGVRVCVGVFVCGCICVCGGVFVFVSLHLIHFNSKNDFSLNNFLCEKHKLHVHAQHISAH